MHQFRNWRWYKGLGGGPLSDLGAHQIDIFNWWLGKTPKSVVASGGLDYFKNHDWYDNAMVIYEYPLARGCCARVLPGADDYQRRRRLLRDRSWATTAPSRCRKTRPFARSIVKLAPMPSHGTIWRRRATCSAKPVVRGRDESGRAGNRAACGIRDSCVLQQATASAAPGEFLQRHPRHGKIELSRPMRLSPANTSSTRPTKRWLPRKELRSPAKK